MTIVVAVCEGSPADRHARFTVAAFQRAHADLAALSVWSPLDHWDGTRLRSVEQFPIGSQSVLTGQDRAGWLRYRFRCGICHFEAIRNDDHRQPGAKLYAVLDTAAAGGLLVVPVRELVTLIDRQLIARQSPSIPVSRGKVDPSS
jgi:hypothetical protein